MIDVTAAQSGSVQIDAAASAGALRLDDITIAAGAGTFRIGDGSGTTGLTLGGAGGQTHAWANNSSNTAVVGSEVTFGLGGGGAHTLALSGTGNWTFNNVMGQGTGTLTVTKTGTGTLTMAGANTYTGATNVTLGTVNLTGNLANSTINLNAASGTVSVMNSSGN